MRRAALVLLVLLLPLAMAQFAPTGPDEPSPTTGNNGSAPGPAESTAGTPGFVYGGLVLVGTLAFAIGLAYVSMRYHRDRRRR